MVFVGRHNGKDFGSCARLTIEEEERSGGPSVFYPDTVQLGITTLDKDWRDSFGLALEAANALDLPNKPPLEACRWHLRFPQVIPLGDTEAWRYGRSSQLAGCSASAAAACALAALRCNLPLDPHRCISANVMSSEGQLGDVGDLWVKLKGLKTLQLVKTLLVHQISNELVDLAVNLELQPPMVVETLALAVDHMTGRMKALIAYIEAERKRVLGRLRVFVPQRIEVAIQKGQLSNLEDLNAPLQVVAIDPPRDEAEAARLEREAAGYPG